MVKKKFLQFFIFLGAAVFLLDTVTKSLVLRHNPDVVIIPDIMRIVFTKNTGISFGLLQNAPFIPIIVSFGVIGYIIWNYKNFPQNYLAQTGLSLIFAGTLGNLTDRFFHGFVIDFISMNIWPAFNIADSAIVIGALLITIHVLKKEK